MPLTPEAIGKLLKPYLSAAPAEATAAADWPHINQQLREYLSLLMKWNARINLTAIHTPEEIVRRHFGESLFAGLHLIGRDFSPDINSTKSERALAPEISLSVPAESGTRQSMPQALKPQADEPTFVTGVKSRPIPARPLAPEVAAPEASTLLDFGSGAGFPGLPIQILHPGLRVTLAEARHKKASFLREVIRALGLHAGVWGERVEAMPASRLFDIVTLRAVDEMGQAVAAASHRASGKLVILGTTASSYPVLRASFRPPETIPIPETVDGSLLIYSRK